MHWNRPRWPAIDCSWIAGLAVICLLADSSAAVPLATFYVRSGGNDNADGLTPDTAFASVNRAATALRNPGDKVIVGPGTFQEGDISPARSGFAGHPVELLADPTGVSTGDPAGPVVILPQAPQQTTGFLLAGRHHVIIDGFRIVGASDAGIQVRADAMGSMSSDIVVSHNETRDGLKRGIDITAGREIVVEGNVANSNGTSGVSVAGLAEGTTLTLSGNQAVGNGVHGIFVSGLTGAAIEDNEVRDNMDTGILVRSSSDVSLAGNVVRGNQTGIGMGTGATTESVVTNAILTKNEVYEAARVGIDIVAADTVTLEQNVVANNGISGLTLMGDGATKAVVRSNQIQTNQADGIVLRGMMPLTVTDNDIEMNAATGLRIRDSSNVAVTDNIVDDNGEVGVDAVSSGSLTLKRNSVAGNTATGVSLVAAAGATIRLDLTNNSISKNGSGLFIGGASGGTVADNTVADQRTDGVVIRQSTRLSILRNQVTGSNGNGLAVGVGTEESGGSEFVVLANQVRKSAKAGITVFATGSIAANGNTVTESGMTGLSLQAAGDPLQPSISNNTVGMSGTHGIFLRGSEAGVMQNNVVFSNGDTGITLRSAPGVLVANNLVYANVREGLAVGTGDLAAPNAIIVNNTVYANGSWGLLVGTSLAPSAGAMVVSNIFQANVGGGIAIAGSSTCGYIAGHNVNVDGYGMGTPRSAYDVIADPLLFNPAGLDGRLGGAGYADDDFHLQQGRGGQTLDSPAVDAGPTTVAQIGLTGTTARGGAADLGTVDVGYHYGASAEQELVVVRPFMPIFVRKNGTSANDGLDPSRALASIQEAAELADAGGTVVVGPGRYAEGDIHPDQNRGPVTFLADSSGVATGDPPGTVLIDVAAAACDPVPSPCDTGFTLLNACGAVVQGFHVTGGIDAGIQVREGSDDVKVYDNVVFSNARRGIQSLGANGGEIRNNLVYANGTGGISVEQGNNADVSNNTVYANGDVGILVGGSADESAALGVAVFRNIVAGNGRGVKVQPNSFLGYFTGFNVVPDGFMADTPRGDSDFVPDATVPLFVSPAGRDGMLAGEQFLDDDFHLVQQGSVAVDIDLDDPDARADGSTRNDQTPDLGATDAGFHYPFWVGEPHATPPTDVVFVRTAGSDDNDGRSAGHAFASVERALAAASNNGLIVIGPGIYHERHLQMGLGNQETVILLGDESGTLTGEPPGRVVIDSGGRHAPTVAGGVLIDGLTLTGARGPGLRVLRGARGVTIRNSTVCGNTGDGVVTAGDTVTVANSLIWGNGGAGITVRLRRALGSTQLLNNTVAANQKQGVVVRETGARASHALLYNNIVSGNGGTGITAPAIRERSPSMGRNLNTDGYGRRTVPGLGDLTDAPRFAAGVPQPAVGCGAIEQLRVGRSSPAIDAGVGTAIEMGLGTRSATTDDAVDSGPTDLGYHYRQ